MIEKGQKAPNFRLKTQGNEWIELNDLLGHNILLFFFPRIETLDDQVHVITYAKEIEWFQRLGVIVIGICGSSVESLSIQSKRLFLPYILLSDPEGVVRKAYDVWNKKITFGTERWITARTALLIDASGMIFQTYKRAKIESNAYEVLEYLQHRHDKEEWRKLSRRTKERIRKEQAQQEQSDQIKKAQRYIKTR